MPQVTPAQAQAQLPDWTVIDGRLELSVRAKNFLAAIEFINRFAAIAEEQNHHPDFDVRYNTIRLRVVSHDVGGLSDRDLAFAEAVDELIAELELQRQPQKISRTHVVFTTSQRAAIKPFWQAILDFKDDGDDGLADRSDVLPPVRFLSGQRPTEAAGGVHLEVFVPAAFAQARLQAALDAGGTLVSEAAAGDVSHTWELRDADGNTVTLHTAG